MTRLKILLGKYKKELALATLIFLVATISFAFGYLANGRVSRAPIIFNIQEKN